LQIQCKESQIAWLGARVEVCGRVLWRVEGEACWVWGVGAFGFLRGDGFAFLRPVHAVAR